MWSRKLRRKSPRSKSKRRRARSKSPRSKSPRRRARGKSPHRRARRKSPRRRARSNRLRGGDPTIKGSQEASEERLRSWFTKNFPEEAEDLSKRGISIDLAARDKRYMQGLYDEKKSKENATLILNASKTRLPLKLQKLYERRRKNLLGPRARGAVP